VDIQQQLSKTYVLPLFRYYVGQVDNNRAIKITDLQKEILKHVCMRRDADYKTLSKATDRDRITLLQSLQSLNKHRFVYSEKDNPNRVKSKLIFKPTPMGRAYASTILKMDLDDIRSAQSDDYERRRYDEFIKQVPNPSERKRNERRVMEDLLQENLFDENGNIPDIDKLLNQLLRTRLLRFIRIKNFDFNELFGTTGAKELKAISTKSELKEFKKLLTLLRDNLDSSIKCLPS
jgi:predicted transcriptional regulator